MRRIHRNSDAGADIERLAGEIDGLLQRHDDAFGQIHDPIAVAGGHQYREFISAQARNAIIVAQQVTQPRRHLAQHMIAGAVAQRVIHILEAIQIHDENRQHPLLLAGVENFPLQPLAELRAVRQLGQRILVRQFQDALLALGDARAHVIEALREYSDLIAAMYCDGHGVIATAYSLDRFQQRIDRPRDGDGDQHTAADGKSQAEQAQGNQFRTQIAKAAHGVVNRTLQHRDDVLCAALPERHHAQLMLLRHGQHARRKCLAVWRQAGCKHQRLLRPESRCKDIPLTVLLNTERYLQSRQSAQFRGQRLIDGEADHNPADRERSLYWHRNQLQYALVEHFNGGSLTDAASLCDQRLELRRAVEQGELRLYYQPKVTLSSAGVHAAEALIRWVHPVRGMVPPALFIPFAEHTGYIKVLTRWVLSEAIRQCGVWLRQHLDIEISVNLSARDLMTRDLPELISALLSEHGVAPHMICLEITESGFMEDPAHAQRVLDRLSAIGLRLSIDDYGTGYSSLSYIMKLPVNELKIDRAFVSNMSQDADMMTIVRSTIELGHSLGLKVVAEGVEDSRGCAVLRSLGCDLAQGYYISPPMPAEALPGWLNGSIAIRRLPESMLTKAETEASELPVSAVG